MAISTDRVANLNYGAAIKVPVKVATTGSITLAGAQTIDGVAVTLGDRVLVKDQSTSSQNGIYDVTLGAWSRSVDFDGQHDIAEGTLVYVAQGTVNGGRAYRVSTASPAIGSSLSFALANGADTAFFTPTGTGAVTRSVQAKLRDVVSVKDFGAVGNGVADDTAAIQAAFNAMALYANGIGGGVYFPAGSYKVTSEIKIDYPGHYYGEGWGSRIITNSATANIFTVNAEQVHIEKLSFASSVTRSGGWYVDATATANRFRLSDFAMEGAYQGIRFSAIATCTIERGQLLSCVPTYGVCIRIDNGFDVSIRDILTDQASQIFAGIYITQAGDVTIEDCSIIHAGQALFLDVPTGKAVASVWANNTYFDTSSRGLYVNATGGSVVRCIFDQCWFSSALNEGVRITTSSGGVVDGLDFNGCHMFLNAGDGLYIGDTGVTNVRLSDCAIAQNTGNGINVAANVNSFSIQSCRIGDSHGLSGNAGAGVNIAAGTGNYIHVVNNDLRGNTGAAMVLGATGSNIIVDGNLGYNESALTYTPTVTAGSGSFTAVGTKTGSYFKVGKRLWITLSVTITTNGTAATSVGISLPSGMTAARDQVITGRESAVSGKTINGLVAASGTSVSVVFYDGTYPGATGATLVLSGMIELA